ncbi:MAG: ATP-binding protein [Candidatus Helarchaeota archaeon]
MENEKYYEIIAKKLDASIQGLSKIGTQGNVSDTWMEYLRVLIPPEDVKYLAELNVFPSTMTARKFAKKIKKSEEEATEILERLFKNDCVMRIGSKTRRYAIHAPFMLFDVPTLSYFKYPEEKAKKLATLSYKFMVDEEWYRNFEGSPDTPLSRVIPVRESVTVSHQILAHEDVLKIIESAQTISLQNCLCRMRYEFFGNRKCDHPLETCLGLNQGARYFIDRGLAREIDKEEAKKLVSEFRDLGLVHTTENFRDGHHTLICSCCACCCNLLGGITKWDNPRAVAAANYLANVKNITDCIQCETCVEKCNFNAITLNESGPEIDQGKCMGCGVCVVNCPSDVIELIRQEREEIYKDLPQLAFKVAKETNRDLKLF